MMLGARTGAWSGKRLPYDAEVEWIRSDRTAFVDTLIIPDDECGMFGSFISSHTYNQVIFGVREDSSDSRFTVGTTANQQYVGFNSSSGIGENFFCEENDVVYFEYNKNNSRALHWMNLTTSNEVVYPISGHLQTTYTRPIRALKGNWMGGILDQADIGMKVINFGITRGDAVAFDATAVRVGQVGAMYDRVSGELFFNAGMGTIIVGPDKTT